MFVMCLLAFIHVAGPRLCNPPPEHPPLYVTAYDWREGVVNCDDDCSEVAIGLETQDWMIGRVAACPQEWLGRIRTTVLRFWDRIVWCVDSFGAPHNRILYWHADYGWVYRVDLALADPLLFGWQLIRNYSRSWREVGGLRNE